MNGFSSRPPDTARSAAERQARARRHRAAVRRRRRRRRALLCLFLFVLACAAALYFLFASPLRASLLSAAETPAQSLQGGTGETEETEDDSDVDTMPRSGDSETVLALKSLAADYPAVKKILKNIDLYPTDMLEMLLKNQEAIDYVVDYPEKYNKTYAIDLSAEAAQSTVPLLLQWDERWGYEEYGSGLMGWTGCGPTCMSMLILYLTGDDSWDPASVARWAEENGYYSEGAGTAWTFMGEGCTHFGLRAEELPLTEQYITNALDEGRPVVCIMGPGDFTSSGHYIILTGYDEDGFTVNDPNSPLRSGQHWTYETLESQINNLWAFSKA